jgi:hypothetical protein
VAVLSKDRSIIRIKVSNPAGTTDFHLVFVVFCVGCGLCEEVITRSEESYRLCVSSCT